MSVWMIIPGVGLAIYFGINLLILVTTKAELATHQSVTALSWWEVIKIVVAGIPLAIIGVVALAYDNDPNRMAP